MDDVTLNVEPEMYVDIKIRIKPHGSGGLYLLASWKNQDGRGRDLADGDAKAPETLGRLFHDICAVIEGHGNAYEMSTAKREK